MRVLLCTDFYISEKGNFIEAMSAFDETFGGRYCEEQDLGNFGKSMSINGERHWEADKYNVFYLNVEEDKIEKFIDFCKSQEYCRTVLEVDSSYKMIGNEALFNRNEKLPRNLKAREENFTARAPELKI